MNEDLNTITGITESECKNIFRWVATLSTEQTIGIFQDAVRKSFQLKSEHPELPGRTAKYCAFILAARAAGWDTLRGKGYRVASQPQFEDFSYLRENSMTEILKKSQKTSRRGRIPVVRRKVMSLWGEVRELRNKGFGFRKIAEYLAKKRRVKISWPHLARIWREVEDSPKPLNQS